MNAQAVVNINVNKKPFDDFMAEFDKYVKLLGRTPAAWAQMSSQQKAMVMTMNQGVAALMAQNSIMHKNALAAKDLAVHSEKTHFHWKGLAERGKKFGEYVLHAHEHIMKWAGIVGGVMTGMGAASGWGLYGLGQWVRGGSIAGSRVNMGSHELRAVQTSIGDPYGIDVVGIAKMVATAQGNSASNEYRQIKSFTGRNPESLTGTGKVTEVLLGLIERMERGDTPARIAAMSGGAFNEGDLHSAWANRAAIREAAAKAPAEAERVKVDPKTEKAWNDFITHLQTGGEILKKILVVGLEPFLKTIEANSARWLAQFEKFMNDPETKKFMEELPGKLGYAFGVIVEQLEWVGKKLGWIQLSEQEKHEEEYQRMRSTNDTAHMDPGDLLRFKKERSEDPLSPENVLSSLGKLFRKTTTGIGNTVIDEGQLTPGNTMWTGLGDAIGDAIVKKFQQANETLGFPKPQSAYQDGTPMVPRTGTYTLHRGEMVLPESDADLLRHSSMADWKRSISGIEGGYGSVNKTTGASGKYQVMPGNIASWTQAALGRAMSVEQFRASPDAQERVFEYMFGQYVRQFGNPIDAASAWFTGQPYSGNKSGPDAMGTTLPGYIKQFLAGLGASSAGRASIEINDNTGGNVAMAMSQMSMVALPLHPI